ncbi:MAG TPA: family 16 glycoside hydrolase, partial [Thermoanaerobaculia bacterium]
LLALLCVAPQGDDDNLGALVSILKETDDDAFRLDILRGIRDGLKGRPSVPMPRGWSDVSERLAKSPNAEVRSIAQQLATTFGDRKALEALRVLLADRAAAAEARKGALDSLLGTRDEGLPPLLLALLADPALRGAAIRGLATYSEPTTPSALLKVYRDLDVSEQRDVINTLASRKDFARALVEALRSKVVPRTDLTAATIRQLKEHGDAEIDSWIDKEWGIARATPEDRLRLIAQYKERTKSGPKGDPSKGRLIFSKTCVQCHTLFEPGGKVGPDITGANRQDLDYLFSNILDPSAVIGKDYQATLIRLKNDRVITGIVKSETKDAVTMLTENDVLVVPLAEIGARRTAEVSMMPEGLLLPLNDDMVRDLIAYLQSPRQVPLPQGAAVELFNGRDLTGWEGDPGIWTVEDGDLVGRGDDLKHNAFLFSKLEAADFRLVFEVKLKGSGGFVNSGFQFRSVPHGKTEAKGCQADIGAGWWGKLYEELGRALLWDKSGEAHVKPGQWNTYEIEARGSQIRTW